MKFFAGGGGGGGFNRISYLFSEIHMYFFLAMASLIDTTFNESMFVFLTMIIKDGETYSGSPGWVSWGTWLGETLQD